MADKKELKKLEVDASVTLLLDHGVDVSGRTIYDWDRFDLEESANNILDGAISSRVIKGIKLLSRESDEPITILINSYGGCVSDGYAIYDTMRSCKCQFKIEVVGACHSAATLVLAGGDERVAHKNAIFLIHDGTPGNMGNTVRDSEAWAEYGKRERHNYYKILAEASKMPATHWEKLCASDKLMSPVEALSYGLITKIVPHKPRAHKP